MPKPNSLKKPKQSLRRTKNSTSNHSWLANANNETLSRFKYFGNNNIRNNFGLIDRKNITTPEALSKEISRRNIELKSQINAIETFISVLQNDAKQAKNQAKKQQIENAISKYVDEYTKLKDIQQLFNSRWMQKENNKTTRKNSSKRSSKHSSKHSSKRRSTRSSSLSLLNGLEEASF
jgi:hypothetical protein